MKLKFEEEQEFTITLTFKGVELKALYEKLMHNLRYPEFFWDGKSPSDEVEEFLKKLQKVYKRVDEMI